MDRLLNGRPRHSDGKLTIKALAEEAQLKRWILTHKHIDLQDEFRARVGQRRGQMPAEQQRLTDQNRIHQERIRNLSAQLATKGELTKRYARIVQVLTLENEQLHRQIAALQPGPSELRRRQHP
jgi:hypothetical protein